MGQKLLQEKIGRLTQSGGVVTLASSIIDIGGQQYQTSALNLTLSGLSAATRYQIYAVQSAGVVSLVQSTNENSSGPSGYTSWKLVGSFNTDSGSSFAGFIDINGDIAPKYFIKTTASTALNLVYNNWATITYDNVVDSDDYSASSLSSYVYTVIQEGLYFLVAGVALNGAADIDLRISFAKNGGNFSPENIRVSQTNGNINASASVYLQKGDTIGVRALQRNGTSATLAILTTARTFFEAAQIQGPANQSPIKDL